MVAFNVLLWKTAKFQAVQKVRHTNRLADNGSTQGQSQTELVTNVVMVVVVVLADNVQSALVQFRSYFTANFHISRVER